MLPEVELESSTEWFLVASEGAFVLRILTALRIGADESGDLVLNPQPEQELVEFSHSGGQLLCRCLRGDLRLSLRGRQDDTMLFDSNRSVNLHLAHSHVTITRDFTPGGGDLICDDVALVPCVAEPAAATPAPVTRIPDAKVDNRGVTAAPAAAPRKRVAPAARAPTPRAPAVHAPVVVDKRFTSVVESRTSSSELRPPAARRPAPAGKPVVVEHKVRTLTAPARPHPHSAGAPAMPRHRPGVFRTLASTLLAIAVCAIPSGESDRMTTAPDPTVPSTEATIEPNETTPIFIPETVPTDPELFESVVALIESIDKPYSATMDFARHTAHIILQSDPSHVGARQLLSTLEQRETSRNPVDALAAEAGSGIAREIADTVSESADERIAEAEAMLRAGSIIEPFGNNAVKLLQSLLRDKPADAAALDLLRQCAEQIIAKARTAQLDGNEYEARNLIEEVLSFYPGHPQARNLWQDLTATE